MKTLRALFVFGLSFAFTHIASAATSAPLEHHYANVNGVRLHYVTAGSGELMVFLHGFPEFWYQWKPQLVDLSSNFETVAPDLRGFGLSSRPAAIDQYRVRVVVEDVRALIDHLGRKKVILVGQDWGGAIAWAFALYHPEYIDKLIVINAPHPALFDRELKENPAQQLASHYILFLRSANAAAALSANNFESLLSSVLDGEKNSPSYQADRDAYLQNWHLPGGVSSAINYYLASAIGPPDSAHGLPANGNYTPDLKSTVVHVPTLVIWGMKDNYILTGNLSGIEHVVPGVKVELIANGNHWLNRENAAEVNAMIRKFVSENGADETQSAP
jgi:pimeloyl-ACP methyl ester carboxylesterase